MPQLNWDSHDFLECFEVEPQTEEYDVSHSYEIVHNGIRLLISVWQYESAVQISLFQTTVEQSLVSLSCFVRGEVRHINDKRGNYIELANCVIGPDQFWYQESASLFDTTHMPHGTDIQISIKPAISVKLGRQHIR